MPMRHGAPADSASAGVGPSPERRLAVLPRSGVDALAHLHSQAPAPAK